MPKKLIICLTCALSLGFYGSSGAHPLDSPDIVYIDGLPCNSACQSYMEWSRRTLRSAAAAPVRAPKRTTNLAAHRSIGGTRERAIKHERIAKRSMPGPGNVRKSETAALQPSESPAAERSATEVAGAAPAATAIVTTPTVRTVREQVMAATTLAENVSAADTRHEADNSAASQNNVNNLVALLITSGDIQSVSDLDNKDLAIEQGQSVPRAIVGIALAAAGAPGVRLSEGETKPIDRVTGGEVPAALLTLVSPAAAEWFPDIKGFKVFRIPLTVYTQNTSTPKPEDAERNAFETPTAGKSSKDSSGETKDEPKSPNPESRMNDDPPPQEKVGAPNTAPK
jgi:hypothetical protein